MDVSISNTSNTQNLIALTSVKDIHERRLGKTILPGGKNIPYPKTWRHTHELHQFKPTISAFRQVLEKIAAEGGAPIRGFAVEGLGQEVKRNMQNFPEGPLYWAAIDVDKNPLRGYTGSLFDLAGLAGWMRSEFGFTGDFLLQVTSSHGFRGDKASLRLWFILKNSLTNIEMRRWAAAINASYQAKYALPDQHEKLVDPALYTPVQLHYVCPPQFDGIDDPMAGASRFYECYGDGPITITPPLVSAPRAHYRTVRTAPIEHVTGTALARLAAGNFGETGVNGAMGRAVAEVLRSGQTREATRDLVLAAALTGAELAGRQDRIQGLRDGAEVQRWIDTAERGLAQTELAACKAAEAGFEVKDDFAANLKALARQETGRFDAAMVVAVKHKSRVPRRQSVDAFVSQIADAARLEVAEREELRKHVQGVEDAKRLVTMRRLCADDIWAEAVRSCVALGVVRQAEIAGLPAWAELNREREVACHLETLKPLTGGVQHVASPAEALEIIIRTVDECRATGQRPPVFIAQGRHGSGKTRIIFKGLADKAASEVIPVFALSPLRSLAAEQAKVLGGVSYTDLDDNKWKDRLAIDPQPFKLPYVSAVSAVQDSLTKANLAKRIRDVGYLLMDEGDHLIAAQGRDSQMSESANRQAIVQQVTIEALKAVEVVVMASADFSPRILAYAAQAEREIMYIAIDDPDAPFTFDNHITGVVGMQSQVARAVRAGIPVLVSSDSAEQIKRIEELCLELGLVPSEFKAVHADSEDNAEFFKDVNTNVLGLKVLAYSPSMGSGVSITNDHFKQHIYGFCGKVSPNNAVQMIRRDRTMQHLDLYWIGNGIPAGETDEFRLCRSRQTARFLALNAKESSPEDIRESDLQYASLTAEDNRYREDCQNMLVYLLEARGGERGYADEEISDEDAEFSALVAENCKTKEIAEIAAAADTDFDDEDRLARGGKASDDLPPTMSALRLLKNQGKLSKAELAIYRRGQIKRMLGLSFGDPLTEADITLGLDKTTYNKIIRIEQAMATDEQVAREAKRDWNRATVKKVHPEPRRELFKYVLGDFVAALEGQPMTLDAESAEGIISRVLEREDFARFCGLPIPRQNRKHRTGFAVGLLNSFGIVFNERRQQIGGDRVRVYDVDIAQTQVLLDVVARRALVPQREVAETGLLAEERGQQRGWRREESPLKVCGGHYNAGGVLKAARAEEAELRSVLVAKTKHRRESKGRKAA